MCSRVNRSAAFAVAVSLLFGCSNEDQRAGRDSAGRGRDTIWKAPDPGKMALTEEGRLAAYGRELIAHTSVYLGPKGRIASISNGMNCQNCHLDAGGKPWGNNYSAVFSTYPRFRDRSGTIENIYRRVNDCLERSLDGAALDTNSREMKAIYTYMKWLGSGVPKGVHPVGAGIRDIPFLDRAADPAKGQLIYEQKCKRCHGVSGEGLVKTDNSEYVYPPLWGNNSYSTAAGLYRLSRLAAYLKDNMPIGASHDAPQLTDMEAWDAASFVNSQPRPQKIFKKDWPDLSRKPIDYPFGPYADCFPERQHKYGPFKPISEAREEKKAANK